MAYVRSIEEYRRLQEKRIKNIGRIQNNTPIKGAKFLAAELRRTAPRKSGKLLSTIKRTGKSVRVSGVDSKTGFPYIHWINQTKGFRTLHYPRGAYIPGLKSYSGSSTQILPPGGRAVYGSSPSNWIWTGKAGFVSYARLKTRRWFKKVSLNDTRKAINVNI